ncbi:ABC transporter substrate-binding protein [Acidithiobacillus ferrivorans]|uniref:ABC transporter substrate-binding protein n=1 Tax=Acidithiobacillus ferrivorans TaxID=160808 RepID=A0A7T5BGY7_9PROT|nr:ABC transporter substrate-binding protein [Acidithiobacillus ferrivorans]QQD71658.1 ABC transporter substrate-binding protein [Acidithiobacillus ferrivorans]
MIVREQYIKVIILTTTCGLISLGSAGAWAAGLATQTSALSTNQVSTPEQVISDLNTALIQSMRTGPSGTYEQRFHILYPVIRSAFNFPLISQMTLGSGWNSLNISQQNQFVQVLTKYSAANYASHFDHYAGQKFSLSPPKMAAGGDVIITSVLISHDGAKNQFAYILRKSDGQWQILNVSTDGVSNMAIEKSEFTGALKKVGFDALMEQLKAHTANLAQSHT